ncbi:PREDICTED: receptor kinase [Prunus dulcis]|uniref:PREDICTED: receptor kinase n=1 Tax=Prunus dulcis TaxID=3755 RepID=A0A5E4EWJ8_PRUDU|nr:PREDICTED: receptor kinase [Prunus dulcis]
MTLASTDPKPSSPSKQSLTITFTPSRAIPDAYAFVNGIEIVSMPTNLYYTASESNGVDYVGNEVNYRIENMTAMEMVYRINVGGSAHSTLCKYQSTLLHKQVFDPYPTYTQAIQYNHANNNAATTRRLAD